MGHEPGHDGRVGIELATTGGTELLEPVDVARRVHAPDVSERADRGLAQFVRTIESRRRNTGERGLDPAAPLGMPRRRQMLVEVGAGEDVDGRCHGDTLRTRTHPVRSAHSSPADPAHSPATIRSHPPVPGNAMLGRCRRPPTLHRGNRRSSSAMVTSRSIRPLTPDDRDALATFHRRQSKDSIYRRYFSPKPELSERDLHHFTHIDMTDRVALAVESHGEFIAWASYERWPGRSEAEAAFMVDDAHQGEGIATLLLEHLAAIARSNGIDRFTAEVLADNRPMLAVFAKSGWPLQRRFDSRSGRPRLGTRHDGRVPRQRRAPRATGRLAGRRAPPDPAGDRRDRRVATGPARSAPPSGTASPRTRACRSTRSTRPGPCSATTRATPRSPTSPTTSHSPSSPSPRNTWTTRSTPASPSTCAAPS